MVVYKLVSTKGIYTETHRNTRMTKIADDTTLDTAVTVGCGLEGIICGAVDLEAE